MRIFSLMIGVWIWLLLEPAQAAGQIKCKGNTGSQLCEMAYTLEGGGKKKVTKWVPFRIQNGRVETNSICRGKGERGSLTQRECRRHADLGFRAHCRQDRRNTELSPWRRELYCHAAAEFFP